MSIDTTLWDDTTLISKFVARQIPNAAFTHVCHLRVAYLTLRDADFESGYRALKNGILALNQANQVPNTPTRGFHETLTYAWARVVYGFCQSGTYENSLAFLRSHPELSDSHYVNQYYGPGQLMSAQAKSQVLMPTQRAFPGEI